MCESGSLQLERGSSAALLPFSGMVYTCETPCAGGRTGREKGEVVGGEGGERKTKWSEGRECGMTAMVWEGRKGEQKVKWWEGRVQRDGRSDGEGGDRVGGGERWQMRGKWGGWIGEGVDMAGMGGAGRGRERRKRTRGRKGEERGKRDGARRDSCPHRALAGRWSPPPAAANSSLAAAPAGWEGMAAGSRLSRRECAACPSLALACEGCAHLPARR